MLKLTVCAICVLFLTAGPSQAQGGYETLNRALTDGVVIPAYERMAQAMAGLEDANEALCATPGADRLKQARDAFHTAMAAWQRVQPIVFGPIVQNGRASRIEFWPDKSGVAERQVRRALQARDPALIADGGIAGKSVALQNTSTYERLVFDDDTQSASESPEGRYACALAARIAGFQSRLAAEIRDDWLKPGGFRESVLGAAGGNAHYTGADQPATDFLKSLTGALDIVIQLKLERPLGNDIAGARPKLTENRRSEPSLDNIIANLETVQALYETQGSFGDLLSAAGAEALDIGLRKGFAEVIEKLRGIDVPLHAAVGRAAERAQLMAVMEKLKSMRLVITGPVADEIGLVVGFNATDGD
jgi:predicted lipoprotein